MLFATFIFYFKSWSFDFVWDDLANFSTLSNMNILDAIKPSGKVLSLSSLFASNWRPLTNAIYLLFNDFSPKFAHLVNTISFSLTSSILALIIYEISKNPLISIICALLFSFHPANVESAVWSSSFSIFLVPSSLAIYFYVKSKEKTSVGFYALSLFFKESSLSLFLPFLVSLRNKLIVGIITLAYLLLRHLAVGVIPVHQKPHYDLSTIVDMIYGLGFYFKSLIFPYPFRVYTPEVPKDVFNIIFLLVVLSLMLWLFVRQKEMRFWILLLASNLILHIAVVGFERAPSVLSYRYMALSILALCVILAYIVKEQFSPMLLPCVVIYGAYSYMKMDVWQNNLTFWHEAYKTNKEDPTVLLNYGTTLLSRRDEKGLGLLWKIYKGNYSKNDRFDAGVNIMAYFYNNGDFERCVDFSKEISKLGESDLYYYLRALCLVGIGDTLRARRTITLALKKYPERPEIRQLAKILGVMTK